MWTICDNVPVSKQTKMLNFFHPITKWKEKYLFCFFSLIFCWLDEKLSCNNNILKFCAKKKKILHHKKSTWLDHKTKASLTNWKPKWGEFSFEVFVDNFLSLFSRLALAPLAPSTWTLDVILPAFFVLLHQSQCILFLWLGAWFSDRQGASTTPNNSELFSLLLCLCINFLNLWTFLWTLLSFIATVTLINTSSFSEVTENGWLVDGLICRLRFRLWNKKLLDWNVLSVDSSCCHWEDSPEFELLA